MEPRISLVTLGVADVDAARAFYQRMGWEATLVLDDVVFLQAGSLILGLWGRDQLAEDSGVADGGGWGGVTLAHNVTDPETADSVIEEAREAGAHIAREPAATPWGGYSGVFIDPDGQPWEVAHNPGFELRGDGAVILPTD